MTMPDIFNADPFSEVGVLDHINHRPYRPLFLETALNPEIQRSFTSDFAVTSEKGAIRVLDYSPRGAPMQQNRLTKRKINKLPIPRFGEEFTVNYDEIRDVSNVPMDGRLAASKSLIDRHMSSVDINMDLTAERQLTHAVRGFITDLDEDVVVDLFDQLGATQKEFEIDVSDSRKKWNRFAQDAQSLVDDELGEEVAGSYLMINGAEIASFLESDDLYNQALTKDGAYRLSLADNRAGVRMNDKLSILPARRHYFEADESYLVPIIPNFFQKVLGPSDSATYEGQVLERYVTRKDLDHGHGWEYKVSSFMLQYPRKPGAIIKLKWVGIPA